jgi:hypothetical protein
VKRAMNDELGNLLIWRFGDLSRTLPFHSITRSLNHKILPAFRSSGGQGTQWIFRPMMFGVPSSKLLSHINVARPPKTLEILGHLYRPAGGG